MNEMISIFMTATFAHWEILVGSVVIFFMLGMVWYSPSFPTGKIWMKYQKMDKNYKPNMMLCMLGQLLMSFILIDTAMGIWLMAVKSGMTEAVSTILLLKIYGGFVITKEISSMIWERRTFEYMLVSVGYYIVGLLVLAGMCSYFL